MALTVVGGSSFLGRYLIKSLAPSYKEIRLGDMYPFRNSVYRLQEELNGKLAKHVLAYPGSLHLSLEGASELVIINHDYFKLAFSNSFYVEKAITFAKEYHIDNITWVVPLELEQLNKLDGDPELNTKETERKARELFPNLKVLRTNLLFGPNCTSLLLHKTIEDLSQGNSIITYKHGHTKFSPVYEEEFLAAFKSLKPGDHTVVAGPEELTWDEIVKILSAYSGVKDPSHISTLDWVKGVIATSTRLGDLFYPSHYQQLYRLLEKTKDLQANVKGVKKLSEYYEPNKFKGIPALNWHRVILD
jgi:hypothetical protein